MSNIQLFDNNAETTLASALGIGATTLTVATGEGALFKTITSPDYQMITIEDVAGTLREIVKVTTHSAASDSFTIERAQEGTSDLAWSIGDKVEVRLTELALNRAVQSDESGNARGSESIDIQASRGASTQVASGNRSVAIGSNSTSSSYASVSIGRNASARGYNSISVGRNSDSRFTDSIAIGRESYSQYNEAISIGKYANSQYFAGISIGSYARSTQQNGIAIGRSSRSTAFESVAVGPGAKSFSTRSVAIGQYSAAYGDSNNSVSIGDSSYSSGVKGVSVGSGSRVTSNNSLSLGAEMINSIADTTMIRNPIAVPDPTVQLNLISTAQDRSSFLTGSIAILTTEAINLTTISGTEIYLPTNFYVEEVGLLATTVSGLTAQPTISFGTTDGGADILANTLTTVLSAANRLQRYNSPLMPEVGHSAGLWANVSTGATASSMEGRFFFKGFFI